MEVRNSLARVCPLVDNKPVAPNQTFLLSDDLRRVQKLQVVSFLREFCNSRDLFHWADEDVDRRLGIDIAKGENVIILVDDLRGNLPRPDPGEKGCHSRVSPINQVQRKAERVNDPFSSQKLGCDELGLMFLPQRSRNTAV
jgi:hypothetical protein